MKEGWTYEKLGEVCELYQPKTISTKEMVSDGKYDVFGANGIIGKYNQYNHEYPEILMTCRGATCGKINISSPKSWINGNAMVIHIKDEKRLNSTYLVYALSFIDKKHIITGAAQPQITRQTLSPLVIAIPPLSEQRSIVTRLDAAFSHIDALKANAEKQLNEARKLFQAELTECMKPKDGWEEKKFGEVCSYHKEQGTFKDMKYIGMEQMESGTGRILGYTSSNEVLSNTFKFNQGEVLYGRLRPYLQKVYVAEFEGCCSTEVFPIKSNNVESGFIKYWLLSEETTNKINATSAGCRMPRGNMNEVKLFEFFFPKEKEDQQAIVAHLDSLSSNIRKLEELQQKTIAECDALKQAMLREVFE